VRRPRKKLHSCKHVISDKRFDVKRIESSRNLSDIACLQQLRNFRANLGATTLRLSGEATRDSMNVFLRSKYSVLLGILATCMAASLAWGQTSGVADQLDSEFKGKILLLRGFYSGNQLEYDQNGVLRSTATQEPWTLANVEITQLTLTPQSIVIVGNRMGILYKSGKPGFLKVGKVKIEVARPNSDADTKEIKVCGVACENQFQRR
jgi:hypothetical protein